MAEPSYEDAESLLVLMEKARRRTVEGGISVRDVTHLFLQQVYRNGVVEAGGAVALRRSEGRVCGCPYSGGRCAAKLD